MFMFIKRKHVVKILIPLVLMLSLFIRLGAADEMEMMDRLGRLEMGQEMLGKRIDDLRSDVNNLRSDVNNLRSELKDVRSELKDIRSELQSEFKDIRSEIKSEIKDMHSEIIGFMSLVIGVVFAGIFALIGFVLWDRRTALAPAIRKNKELEDREDRVEKALKEMAEKEDYIKSALKHAGIL